MGILYFNDYSEDELIPCSGESSLVSKYAILMDCDGTPIDVFDTKEELYVFIAEFASQARNGAMPFKEMDDSEMQELIDRVK